MPVGIMYRKPLRTLIKIRVKLLIINGGSIEGYDRYGGFYSGTYNLEETIFTADLTVSEDPEGVTIYDSIGVRFPFDVPIRAEYCSPLHLQISGTLNGERSILGQGRKIAELIG
jgi:hypothetical protein